MKRILTIFLACASFVFIVNSASAGPVDLSTFYADPGAYLDGDVINFSEDLNGGSGEFYFYNPAFYVNSPNLFFNYSLTVAKDNEDYLMADLYDENGENFLIFLDGGQTGIYSGSVAFNLTPYLGTYIDLGFGFYANDPLYDEGCNSFGSISNVSVPEPATMLLLGSCLICLAGVGRKKH